MVHFQSEKMQLVTRDNVSRKLSGEELQLVANRAQAPVLLKQQIANWPIVQMAQQSLSCLKAYLSRFDSGLEMLTFALEKRFNGRIFYNDDFSGMNFNKLTMSLSSFFSAIAKKHNTLYMGSTNVQKYFPGLLDENELEFGISKTDTVANLWLGNQSLIAAHFDFPNNFACNLCGTRVVTLFPPEQVDNLYIGPLDFNPAGPAISLVDPDAPDFDKYPKYQQAIAASVEFVLEPGDVLFIPSMWWHQIRACSDFNLLMNYWWKPTPAWMPSPMQALNLALMSMKRLPAEQKQAWQHLFKQFVFEDRNFAHIPHSALGVLGEIDELAARKLRAQILAALNR